MPLSVSGASTGTRMPGAAHGCRSRTSRCASRSRVVQPSQSVGRSGPSFPRVSDRAARSSVARLTGVTLAPGNPLRPADEDDTLVVMMSGEFETAVAIEGRALGVAARVAAAEKLRSCPEWTGADLLAHTTGFA